jgi:NitT/TauT family transport system permease protein
MLRTILPPLILLTGIVVLWQVITTLLNIPEVVLARPTQIVAWTSQYWPRLLSNGITTFTEVLVGFVIGTLFGFTIGILISQFKFFEVSLYPLIVATQVIPIVAIAPILVIWFGFGIASKIVVAVIICFFPVVINTAQGLSSVDPDVISLARVNNASRLSILTKVQFPFAVPLIMSGVKLASSLAVIGAIVGEMVGADSGLGYLITYGSERVDTAMMFSALGVLFLMGISLFAVITILQRFASPWFYAMRTNV